MPRGTEHNERLRQASDQKIRAAAAKVFVDKGLAGASIQQIASEAGISLGLMYHHYRSKDELFLSLVDYAVQGLGHISDQLASETDPRTAIEAVALDVYQDMTVREESLQLMGLIVQGILSGNETITQKIGRDNRHVLDSAADCIRRGQALGEFAPGDPDELATYFFASIQGLIVMRLYNRDVPMPSPSVMTAFLSTGVR